MAIAAIVVGFLVTLVGGPSLVDHLSNTQFEQQKQTGHTEQSQLPPEQSGPLTRARVGDETPAPVSAANEINAS
ncbi:hypothetical protein PQR53_23665 [Paraburkholderia fungorum]|uniref:hypothetical protein n=1 Tax=Paraburkholderia fungorum TaxID=134537 RepID=UPI0038B6D424